MALNVEITDFYPVIQKFEPIRTLVDPVDGESEPAYIEETPPPVHLGWSVSVSIGGSWGGTTSSFFFELPADAQKDDLKNAVLKKYAEANQIEPA
jgi:hypothetical protein